MQNEEKLYALVVDAEVKCDSVGNQPSLLTLYENVITIKKTQSGCLTLTIYIKNSM